MPQITYDEARDLVRAQLEPGWTPGTFCLDDRKIVENDTMFVFAVGAREHLVDGDISYAVAGSVPVVYKETGELALLPSVDVGTDPTVTQRPNPDPTLR
ncbi:hypothetical protein [Streptomyces nanshensis]|uniref:Immunity protein 35 domain-containing protein n=1 Tax=Streptomyces nanshensis TaxID=518642 RepID=A0A1E7L8N7_9ACTN|nr:hypothetical protein [Streptomyces nanshensis]OEV12582.1 hypothetical protein AN218_07615 [Streptomyces nanshensis]